MDVASARLKDDVWQVLAHIFANYMILIAIVAIVGALLVLMLVTKSRGWLDLAIPAGGLVIIALLLHAAAWTSVL